MSDVRTLLPGRRWAAGRDRQLPVRRLIVAAVVVVTSATGLGACGGSSAHSNGVARTTTTTTSTTTVPPTTTTSTTTTSTTTVPPTTSTTRPGGPSVDGTQIDQLPKVPSATTNPGRPDLSTTSAQEAFLRGVFADIQSVWDRNFREAGLRYSPARLVLFHSEVNTACGEQSADVGPFYCSGDHTVYLDVRFFKAIEAQFGVSGDFAEAYVVAHEVGHHIQNLLQITHRVAAATQAHPELENRLSVATELQADCFAGVWAHSTYERNLLEPGDIEQALRAAEVVGDDFLARAAGQHASPDSFTHGSSAQRKHWFTTGFEEGRPDACDTFSDLNNL